MTTTIDETYRSDWRKVCNALHTSPDSSIGIVLAKIERLQEMAHINPAVELGKRGRAVNSEAQQQASRANGARPVKPGSRQRGRPRKETNMAQHFADDQEVHVVTDTVDCIAKYCGESHDGHVVKLPSGAFLTVDDDEIEEA